jgi:hypothetical protein
MGQHCVSPTAIPSMFPVLETLKGLPVVPMFLAHDFGDSKLRCEFMRSLLITERDKPIFLCFTRRDVGVFVAL